MNQVQLEKLAQLIDLLQKVDAEDGIRLSGNIDLEIDGEYMPVYVTWNMTAECYMVQYN